MKCNLKRIVYGIGALIFLGALTLFFIYDPSEVALFPKCPFLSFTGLYCPGCGSQRAMHDLLHGDILSGFKHNLLMSVLFFILGYQFFHALISMIKKKELPNIFHRTIVTNGILVFVIAFWVLRNIPQYPFNLLAP